MFIDIIVFLIAITIIFFPIPLKITLKYSKKILEIYIYNKQLMKKKHNKTEPIKKVKERLEKSYTISDIKFIINKFMGLKFKPTLTLITQLEYGFDDAALVAILFGLIHTTNSFLYLLLQKFVKVKNINHEVIPYFKEKDLNMKISCIIYTNLAKIIYMSFIMLICIKRIKLRHKKINTVKYEGGNVHG